MSENSIFTYFRSTQIVCEVFTEPTAILRNQENPSKVEENFRTYFLNQTENASKDIKKVTCAYS